MREWRERVGAVGVQHWQSACEGGARISDAQADLVHNPVNQSKREVGRAEISYTCKSDTP